MSNPKKRAAESAPEAKKKKKKTKFQQDDEALDMELGLNTLFTRMDNQLLADHLAQKIARFAGELSSVELSDLSVSGMPCSSIQHTQQEETSIGGLTCRSKLNTRHDIVAGDSHVGELAWVS